MPPDPPTPGEPWPLLAGPGPRVALRSILSLALILQGASRVIPVAAPPLDPTDQLLRLGEFSRHQLLEIFLGSSPPFQIYTGLGALAAGLLLLSARTALLGSLLAVADLGMHTVQALCYPEPSVLSPLLPGALLFLAFLLVAPDLRRLTDVLVLERPVAPAPPEPLFADPGRQRALDRTVLFVGIAVLLASLSANLHRYRGQHPAPPPYSGAWSIARWTVAGKDVALDDSAPQSWRRLVFVRSGEIVVEDGLGTRRTLPVAQERGAHAILVGGPRPSRLTVRQPAPHLLVLEGELEGRTLHAELRRMALSAERFNWVFVPTEEDR